MVLNLRRFTHHPLAPPSSPAEAQPTARSKTMARHREPQPHRSTPPQIPPCSIPKLRTHHAPSVRLKLRHRRLLRENAKAFLQTHDASLASRPKTSAGKYTSFNYSDIFWAPYSPYWRQIRKLCFTELFSPKRLDSYEYIRKEEIRIMVNKLYNSSEKPIILKDYLNVFNLNIISRMVLGKTYVKKTENAVITEEEFKWMLDELLLLNSEFLNIGDFISGLQWLDLQGYVKRMKIVSKKFERFLEHVLNEHDERRKGIENYVSKDMVDLLLEAAGDSSLEVKLQRNNVGGSTVVRAFSLKCVRAGVRYPLRRWCEVVLAAAAAAAAAAPLLFLFLFFFFFSSSVGCLRFDDCYLSRLKSLVLS